MHLLQEDGQYLLNVNFYLMGQGKSGDGKRDPRPYRLSYPCLINNQLLGCHFTPSFTDFPKAPPTARLNIILGKPEGINAENRADAAAFFSRFLGAFFAVPPQKTGLFRGSAKAAWRPRSTRRCAPVSRLCRAPSYPLRGPNLRFGLSRVSGNCRVWKNFYRKVESNLWFAVKKVFTLTSLLRLPSSTFSTSW
jgi:hypothetical protein